MSHFAKVENGIVTQVLVIEQEQINTGNWGEPNTWFQTSYNTRGNVHYGEDGNPDGGIAVRGNYAAKGMIYDTENDVFYIQKPYPSWILNKNTWVWEAPVVRPKTIPVTFDSENNIIPGKGYTWDESTLSWIEFVKT